MNSDTLHHELGLAGARELLGTAPLARLAYNGLDGLPRVVPIGFFWNGNAVVMCTAVTAPKVTALESRPDVAITIDVGNTSADARALLLRGTAQLETVDGIPDEYIAASRKVLSPAEAAQFAAAVDATFDRMVRISVVPSEAHFYDFGAGRVPSFLAQLASGG